MNDASVSDTAFTVLAICSPKPKGYTQVFGGLVDNPPGTQTGTTVDCPGASVPLGGGGFSSSGSTAVNMNSTFPSGSDWEAFESNASAADASMQASVVCAGT